MALSFKVRIHVRIQFKNGFGRFEKYEWNNGQTEGQVKRLKMIKRQMYGRAILLP